MALTKIPAVLQGTNASGRSLKEFLEKEYCHALVILSLRVLVTVTVATIVLLDTHVVTLNMHLDLAREECHLTNNTAYVCQELLKSRVGMRKIIRLCHLTNKVDHPGQTMLTGHHPEKIIEEITHVHHMTTEIMGAAVLATNNIMTP